MIKYTHISYVCGERSERKEKTMKPNYAGRNLKIRWNLKIDRRDSPTSKRP